MAFHSFAFAVFLPIVFLLYWALPHRFRWILMLSASYYFYMSWNAKYVFLILFTTVVSYGAARLLENERSRRKKKWILAGAAFLCLGVLFFFKYFNFVSESVTHFLSLFTIRTRPLVLNLLLPVGISFYTFQTFSYVVDVYRGDMPAEHHFGYYALFVSFFPQLVAGPIERADNLLPQIREARDFNYDQASYGAKQMLWGFFKKLVIADGLSVYVSQVFDNPAPYEGFSIILASVFFSIQIYCDFSGYSDIAIGTAKLFGMELTANFKSPFFSQSIGELWGRWHISLSTWFRDYVYIPLGGSRVGRVRHAVNLIVTFLVSGLWHGANWTYVVWGGIHGVGQVVENIFVPKNRRKSRGIIRVIRIGAVFAFFTFACIFFASHSLGDAWHAVSRMFNGISSPIVYLHDGFSRIGLDKLGLLKSMIPVCILLIYDYFSLRVDCIQWLNERKAFARHFVITAMILMILCCGYAGQSTFVYFQF